MQNIKHIYQKEKKRTNEKSSTRRDKKQTKGKIKSKTYSIWKRQNQNKETGHE